MNLHSLRSGVALFVALCCCFVFRTAIGAEWSIEPSAHLREEYNSNIHFTTQPHRGVWMTRLSPKLKLSGKTEASEVSGIAEFNLNRYRGESGLNTNDRYLSLLASHFSERDIWSLNALSREDSTAESERFATGVVQPRTQRSMLMLSPSWTRMLTERHSLKLGYMHQDVEYDSHVNLTDYLYRQADATWGYQWSERTQLSASASYSVIDYDPIPRNFPLVTDSVVNENKNRSAQVGVSHRFTETLQGAFSLGRRYTDLTSTHTCPGFTGFTFPDTGTQCTGLFVVPVITFTEESSSNGYFFSASAEQRFDTGHLNVAAGRNVEASGNGVVETDRLAASLNRRLSETLTFNLDTALYRTDYLSISTGDSRYFLFEPRLNWQLTERWSLDAGYRYARFSTADTNPSNNTVFLSMAYSWPKIAISR